MYFSLVIVTNGLFSSEFCVEGNDRRANLYNIVHDDVQYFL